MLKAGTPMLLRRVRVSGAELVCKVREHQVTGLRSLNPDFGGFEVSNLTYHHHVRVLAKEGSQGFGEGKADFRIHVNLVNTLEVDFHRVLGG